MKKLKMIVEIATEKEIKKAKMLNSFNKYYKITFINSEQGDSYIIISPNYPIAEIIKCAKLTYGEL